MTKKNIFPKAAALALTAAMCIGMLQTPVNAAVTEEVYGAANAVDCAKAPASSSPRLNRTSLTLTVGESKTLKVRGAGNAKWSSSDTSVCSVSRSGRVTAKGAGTAKVYASVGGKKLTCKVKVIKKTSDSKGSVPSAPQKAADAAANYPSDTASQTENKTTIKLKIKVVDDGYGNQKFILSTYTEDNANPGSSADYAEEMLTLVNAEREKAGASALELDDDLCKAAQVRAKEVGKVFSHTRPDGSDCFTILSEYSISRSWAGENIAQGSSTSKGVMNLWMNSPGHRSNILNSNFRRIGIGYDDTTNSWVQIFTD